MKNNINKTQQEKLEELQRISEIYSSLSLKKSDFFTSSSTLLLKSYTEVYRDIGLIAHIAKSDFKSIYILANNLHKKIHSTKIVQQVFYRDLAEIGLEIGKNELDYGEAFQNVDVSFSISQTDKDKALKLSAEIRALIVLSEDFTENHKRRLLARLVAVEKEILQPKGKLDVILGAVVDIGDAAEKFGEKVKPLVDRINEIRGITQKGSKEYEGLPSPDEPKRLPAPEEE